MLRIVVASVFATGLVGCAPLDFGPHDGAVVVVGDVPPGQSEPCDLLVAANGNQAAPESKKVFGSFREQFLVYQNRAGHTAILKCGNKVVAERQFKFGRDVSYGGAVVLVATAP